VGWLHGNYNSRLVRHAISGVSDYLRYAYIEGNQHRGIAVGP
jgi:hypothetical protein